MRYITKEMLLYAVECNIPLFEDGDIITEEILRTIHNTPIKSKTKKTLISNLTHSQGKVVYKFTCAKCHEEHQYKFSGSRLYQTMLRFGLKDHDTVGGWQAPYVFDCLVYFGFKKDETICTTCLCNLKETYCKIWHDFCNTDKRLYWLDIVKGKNEKDAEKIIDKHPFQKYYYQGRVRLVKDENRLITDIYEITDILNYEDVYRKVNKVWRNPDAEKVYKKKEAERKEKQEIYRKAYDNEKENQEKIKIEREARAAARRDFLTETDKFIRNYCRPTSQEASKDDLRVILYADNLDEPQLQSSIRAMLYEDFLTTKYWKAISSRRKYMDNLICTECGSPDNLCVHHISYDHHGDERNHFEDLITLCEKCHEKKHKNKK